MVIKVFIVLLVGCLVHFTNGNNQDKLQRLIKEIKGESDKVASEIYAWIDKQKKGFEPHGSRDNSTTNRKVPGVARLTKVLKGESDHLAGELFNWINKHNKSRDQPREEPREQGRERKEGHKSHKLSHFLGLAKNIFSHRRQSRDLSRNMNMMALPRHDRFKRGVTESGDSLEGESIQDVMTNLMNAPHKKPKQRNHETKKTAKRKTNVSKHKNKKVSLKKTKKSKLTKSTERIQKQAKSSKKTKTAKRSEVTKPKISKSTVLPEFLKMIAADPAKKSIVSNLGNNFRIDLKSLKIINKIPKPVLKNLLKNIDIKKYVHLSTFMQKDPKSNNQIVKIKAVKTKKKTVRRNRKILVKKLPKKSKSKKAFIMKKKSYKKIKSKSSTPKKKKITKKIKRKTLKKPTIKKHSGKKHLKNDHVQLSFLKEKIKKTNSLKLKVAKALLEHCETQDKLRKIFDNVNNSLKEATQLAKTIGKKYGIRNSDVDKISTEHTEKAVAEFLDKFF